MPTVITDDDLQRLDPRRAVEWMLAALRLHADGLLTSPPRVRADLGDGGVVVTAGRGPRWYGYRVYDTRPVTYGQQVVVAHDVVSGEVVAAHIGSLLGPARTGALGGAAAALLGPTGAAQVAVVGAGAQAWTQLWAMSAALEIAEVQVASRRPASRGALADRAATQLGLSARAVDSVRSAVEGADVVILATDSPAPVLDASWLADDVLVATVGPKQVGRAEFGMDLMTGADLVVTDSPAQLRAYDPPALVADAGLAADVIALGDLASAADEPETTRRGRPGRRGRRVYLSVGLAGTEVHLLGHLAETLADP